MTASPAHPEWCTTPDKRVKALERGGHVLTVALFLVSALADRVVWVDF
jgi:hypothetical protein